MMPGYGAPEIDGAALLDDVHTFIGRFVAYPTEHARVAHTLWIAHAHLMEAWESTPRIAFLSPEPGSGKTRALEVSELLVPLPVEAVNVTPAYLFRKVGSADGRPTILYDEIDTVFGPKAKDNEEIRGLLNAGHRRGAVAGRCVVRGKVVETEEIPAYCAVALAGLGGLPDTILSRAVVIRMRRRATNEQVEAYRRRLHVESGTELRDRVADWAVAVYSTVDGAWPTMPTGIEDRDADIWEPLLAVADAAGGDWPKRARAAAVTLVTESKRSTPSLGVLLLRDLRTVFGDREVMFTEDVLAALNALEEAPWSQIKRGDRLDARGLSTRLRQYEVKSGTVRIGGETAKGYKRGDLHDPWSRYLPPPDGDGADGEGPPPYTSVTSVTPSQPTLDCDGVTDVTASRAGGPTSSKPAVAEVADVADDPNQILQCGQSGHGYYPAFMGHCPACTTAEGRRTASDRCTLCGCLLSHTSMAEGAEMCPACEITLSEQAS